MKTVKLTINNNNEKITEEPNIKAKNAEKLELLKNIDLTKYDPYLIKILLDGDYKNELGKYKSKVYSFIHEIIENKIKHSKFGINTLLYKMVKDVRKGESIEKYFNRNLGGMVANGKKEQNEEEEEEDNLIELDQENFINAVLKIAKKDRKMAFDIINLNLNPENELYEFLISKI